MRIIDSIPHPSITISIFEMNNKYLVKFEAAMMEQVFKYTKDEAANVDKLKSLITEAFIEKVRERFNEMYLQWKNNL
jgi:hypothetical protein